MTTSPKDIPKETITEDGQYLGPEIDIGKEIAKLEYYVE